MIASTIALTVSSAVLGKRGEGFHQMLETLDAGRLPVWLAPVQAVVATIVSDADEYAKEAVAKLEAAGIRVESDLRNEKINYKVREHSLAKVPVLLVAGRREADRAKTRVQASV